MKIPVINGLSFYAQSWQWVLISKKFVRSLEKSSAQIQYQLTRCILATRRIRFKNNVQDVNFYGGLKLDVEPFLFKIPPSVEFHQNPSF